MKHQDGDDATYLRLTPKMCARFLTDFTKADYAASDWAWEKVHQTLKTGVSSKSGTRIDLSDLPLEGVEHLLILMKRFEQRTSHKQMGDALRARIAILNDFLGVSAVDRLGELM